ncbi:LiaF transmembrane domain-containing protein [Pontibacter sp. CAU 1760]
MENKNQNPNSDNWQNPQRGTSGKVLAGLLLVTVGVFILGSQLHLFFFPHWVFSWPMILIVIGLFIGFKHNFRKSGWLVLVLIGSIFLLNDLIVDINLRVYFWPILLIGLGLWMMLKPKNRHEDFYRNLAPRAAEPNKQEADGLNPDEPGTGAHTTQGNYSTEEVVDSAAILGGVKKNIISKNFRGGEVVSVFGGTELNLSQADLQSPAVLEATQIFGGTSLIVPANWQVKSEVVAILGGMDDKRPLLQSSSYDPNKVLILKGVALFGGLTIKSY